jgi:predicted metalloprotease with PDZ domain
VATQLLPTSDPLAFTAPNLSYLIDSPIEFGDTTLHEFTLPRSDREGTATIRLALHADDRTAQIADFLRDIERIVVEQREVFGELPRFEPGHFTFIVDLLPWARRDAMEHRNSTVITASRGYPSNRFDLLDAVAHEFFHVWNLERIRPRSLEPFDLTDAVAPGELWFGEGFTDYYAAVTLTRAGLMRYDQTASLFAQAINAVVQAPGRRVRSAVDMSRLASFADGATSAERTNLSDTYFSYYTWGAAIGLGLDLSLREHTGGKRSLDDVMRTMWHRYGRSEGSVPGVVPNPYTLADVKTVVGEIAGDAAFAERFFRAYVEGHDVPDYGTLLESAGWLLRPARPDEAWAGALRLEAARSGIAVHGIPPAGTPAADAGLVEDDEIRRVDGHAVTTPGDWYGALARRRPGDRVTVDVWRRGVDLTLRLTLKENPAVEILPLESTGRRLSTRQEAFRDAWLESRVAVAGMR